MGFVKYPIYLPQVNPGLHSPLHRHHRPLSSPPTPRDPPPALHASGRELHAPESGSHTPERVPHTPGSSILLQPPPLDCPTFQPFLHPLHCHGWLFGFLLHFRLYFCSSVFMYFSIVFCCFYFPVVLFGF
jgi:hypothetical protein